MNQVDGMAVGGAPVEAEKEKLPWTAHLLCGWPLVLVAVGGLIGGAVGGAAYAINMVSYRSKMPLVAKIVLNLLVGIAAIAIWFAIASAISSAIDS